MPKVRWQGKDVDALEVRFKGIREDWNEYDLEDGTTLRMKAVVAEIIRVVDQYDQENNPVYMVKSTNMLVVKAPDNLKKKA
ncbi:MAG: hypothetical protein HYX90_06265 [Chloroflexi bacterium]|nr:hypothetical protein [Chloroflexota bacterium]